MAEAGPVDLLKIDIEGAEMPVFRCVGSPLSYIAVIVGELPLGVRNDALALFTQHESDVELTGVPSTPAFMATRQKLATKSGGA